MFSGGAAFLLVLDLPINKHTAQTHALTSVGGGLEMEERWQARFVFP